MYHEEIITSAPGILEKVTNSPQVLFAAEAYFIALSHSLEEVAGIQVDARKAKLDVLQGKFMEIFMGAANGAFRDYWEQQDQKKQDEPDRAFPQVPASPEHRVVYGKLRSITRTEGGFNVHVAETASAGVREHVFYVSKANCLVDKLLFLLNKEVSVEFDPGIKGQDGSNQAYTICLYRPPQ
jgi:hypothetical protein